LTLFSCLHTTYYTLIYISQTVTKLNTTPIRPHKPVTLEVHNLLSLKALDKTTFSGKNQIIEELRAITR